MLTKTRLTTTEINNASNKAQDIAIYRMYTHKGVEMYMLLAKFRYKFNHRFFIRFLANILLIFVDALDLWFLIIEKIKNKYCRR